MLTRIIIWPQLGRFTMSTLRRSLGAAFFACILSFACRAQNACPGLPPVRNTAKGNIFSSQQEVDLGDIIQQQLEPDLHVIHDPALNAYLNRIAQRLLSQMPPTRMKFHIVLVDLPVTNAFTFPGGRIYITRKLVAFTRSEDELASVIGHELGHALTHQPAANFSVIFRQVLGVKAVGDRRDIFLKYNQLIEHAARKPLRLNLARNREAEQVADSYSIYAMSRAGYSPNAMFTLINRITQTNGKSGNWLTDLFQTTTPDEARLRAMKKYIASLPRSCIATKSAANPARFFAWQQAVIGYTASTGKQSLPGLLWKRSLSPPLESQVTNVKFSPDGNYLLAQDDFSVYVLSVHPLKPLFRIPADDVEPASFTPDSKSILIWSRSLHVEKWSLATQRRSNVYEIATPKPCIQTDVSPNGKFAACVRETINGYNEPQFDLSLIDLATGAPMITKRDFYTPTISDFLDTFLLAVTQGRFLFFHVGFSPDSRYFAASRTDAAFAWDLKQRSPVKINSSVRDLMSGGFVFEAGNEIVGLNAHNPKRSGSAHFPSGPLGMQFLLRGKSLAAPAQGDAVLVRPVAKAAVALVNLKTGKVPLMSQFSALDVYGDTYARPLPDGSIGIFNLSTLHQTASTRLPGHWIGPPQAAAISPDLKWFAASGKTRGAVWNLATGTRVFHVHGFSGCGFSPQDNLYALFNAYLKQKRSIAALNPFTGATTAGAQFSNKMEVAQYGPYFLDFQPENTKWNSPFDLQIYDVSTGAALWKRHFSKSALDVYTPPSFGEMAFVLPLESERAKQQEKSDPALRAESKKVSSKSAARLIQERSAATGKLLGQFVMGTGGGSFSIRGVLPAGKWVVVADNKNRVLIYSLDGNLKDRLFGHRPAVSTSAAALALETDQGTLDVYDLSSLERREELKFGMPLAYYQFVDKGSGLFAVTEDQTAYLLSLKKSNAN